MTFLLFLVSVAVLESIVRRTERASPERRQLKYRQGVSLLPPASAETPAAELRALGQALEEHGRGKTPDSEGVSKVSEPFG